MKLTKINRKNLNPGIRIFKFQDSILNIMIYTPKVRYTFNINRDDDDYETMRFLNKADKISELNYKIIFWTHLLVKELLLLVDEWSLEKWKRLTFDFNFLIQVQGEEIKILEPEVLEELKNLIQLRSLLTV